MDQNASEQPGRPRGMKKTVVDVEDCEVQDYMLDTEEEEDAGDMCRAWRDLERC